MTSGRTVKTLQPTQSAQVFATRIFGRELEFKIHQISRVLLHSGEYNIWGWVQ
jgi:hypothetical protein